MPYKELTIDFVLGRCITLGGQRWRILEIDPRTGKARALHCDDESLRGSFCWRSLQALIRDGYVYVD